MPYLACDAVRSAIVDRQMTARDVADLALPIHPRIAERTYARFVVAHGDDGVLRLYSAPLGTPDPVDLMSSSRWLPVRDLPAPRGYQQLCGCPPTHIGEHWMDCPLHPAGHRGVDLPEADIFDVDGTLCNSEPFRYLVRSETPDFEAFHDRCCTIAVPNRRAVDLAVESRALGRKILVVCGRNPKWWQRTHDWLTAPWPFHGAPDGIPFDELHLDQPGPHLPDAEAKALIFDTHVLGRYHVRRAVEDRPSIRDVWRSRGVEEVIMIPGWNINDGP